MSDKGYLVQEAAGGAAQLRIADDVVRGITHEAMRGFGVTRRRGAETGGLLLGKAARDGEPTVVDGFRPVPCQYAFGPSYILSDADHVQFGEAVLDAGSSVVGFYRSHTRDGMDADVEDTKLWSRHLTHLSSGVVLLIRPFATRAPVARAIHVLNGKLETATGDPEESTFQFALAAAERTASAATATQERPARAVPLVTKETPAPSAPSAATDRPIPAIPAVSEAPPVRRPLAKAPSGTPEQEVAPAATSRVEEAVPRQVEPPRFGMKSEADPIRDERKSGVLPLVAAILAATLFGAAAGYQVGRGAFGWPQQPAPVEDPYRLGLRAVPAGEGVRLEWHRDGHVVSAAQKARVLLTSADGVQTLDLDPREFQKGTVVVKPLAAITEIRFEADLGNGRAISENVTWRGSASPARSSTPPLK